MDILAYDQLLLLLRYWRLQSIQPKMLLIMNSQIEILNSPPVDIIGKPARNGPESAIVKEFIASISHNGENHIRRTILIEPIMQGAKPDIVIVDWVDNSIRDWPKDRANLSSHDLKLLHMLYLNGGEKVEELEGKFAGRISSVLDRLTRACMIEVTNGFAYFPKDSDAFVVKRITAFEAKIGAISRAIDQAFRNTWFSSKSYVLFPARTPTVSTLANLSSRGIGLWILNEPDPLVDSIEFEIPNSYGSWLINELIWNLENGSHYRN